jgi:hypothetical protein
LSQTWRDTENGESRCWYFNPFDADGKNIKGKHANLVFHLDNIVIKNANDINQLNKYSFYGKVLPAKIDYEKLSPYSVFRLRDVIQHTLRQNSQIAKSTIHYPMRCHLKSLFH